jgi:protein-tyrosine phosphatase
MSAAPLRILFVCMGNICRSPTAEGVFRAQVAAAGLSERIVTDSAGTHGYHIGEPPDPRSIKAAAARGIDISDLRARMVRADDFQRFDLVLAMDKQNQQALADLCPAGTSDRLRMFMEFAPEAGRREVPDPYYGGSDGFSHVLDLCDAAARGLLKHLRTKL